MTSRSVSCPFCAAQPYEPCRNVGSRVFHEKRSIYAKRLTEDLKRLDQLPKTDFRIKPKTVPPKIPPRNSSTGVIGVYKYNNRYIAKPYINGIRRQLGSFSCLGAAIKAIERAKNESADPETPHAQEIT